MINWFPIYVAGTLVAFVLLDYFIAEGDPHMRMGSFLVAFFWPLLLVAMVFIGITIFTLYVVAVLNDE